MLNRIIGFSLANRALIALLAIGLMVYGGYLTTQTRVDVLPDLNRPTVTIMTEAPGLAPEEVEVLVTFPIESLLNGATGVQRVRSASGVGLSIVWTEFDWDVDIYRARQIVAEKLQLARERLPERVNPVMTPISSIMGEIMLISMAGETISPMEIRTLADWVVRPRLLSIAGVSQITTMGGGEKQYQVIANPDKLRQYDVTIDDLVKAVQEANVNAGGGFLLEKRKEYLIRFVGRVTSPEQLEAAVIRHPVLVKHVAEVRFDKPVQRGDGSINGRPAVILAISKQPEADTLRLTRDIDKALAELKNSLPKDVTINNMVFRQQEFIDSAIANVIEALRDGAILVIVVLFLFLWNFRTSIISLTAIPLSLISTALSFHLFGMSLNTMTLGGLAVAIGELVDDSIVDVENIFRRLKENRQKPNPEPALIVIYKASAEVRNSIVYATLIVCVVVLPLLALPGVEGRLFAPIAVAYLVALLMSLVVSLTVTPALSSYLLPGAKIVEKKEDAALLCWLKGIDRPIVQWSIRHPYTVLGCAAITVALSVWAYSRMGGQFLPPFNEGTITVTIEGAPGTSLQESNRMATIAETLIREVPEAVSTARRTGRAELDEHAQGVNYSEIDVRLKKSRRTIHAIMDDIRGRLAYMPGVAVTVGQPISHRIDHVLSGVRAQIAVKIFGPDLTVLRTKAQELRDLMSQIPGVTDLQLEQQVEVPQILVKLKHDEIQRYGLTAQHVAQVIETALGGRVVSEVLEEQRAFELVVWFDERSRNDVKTIERLMIETPIGGRMPLSTFADVVVGTGPNTINRENVMRRIVVACNVSKRDLASVIADVRAMEPKLNLPQGYFVQYGGQFEAQEAAMGRLYVLGLFALAGVFVLLLKALGSWRSALQCMVNLPLAFVGGVIAIYLFGDHTLSVASLVGFMTLTGIVMRNGIMMISHYIHLMRYEGETFSEAMIVRGTLERLAPVLMTALTTILGLIPLALGKGQTGKEILHPLAITVIGGLISSTILDQMVTPALFHLFGRRAYEKTAEEPAEQVTPPADLVSKARRMGI